MSPVAALSALRIDSNSVGHFYSTTSSAPEALARFVELAERDGLLVPVTRGDCYAVLDLIDGNGDIIDDRAVPNEAAWNALNSELHLSVIASE